MEKLIQFDEPAISLEEYQKWWKMTPFERTLKDCIEFSLRKVFIKKELQRRIDLIKNKEVS